MSQIRTQIHKLKTQGRVILTGDFNAKINITQENCNQQTSKNGKHLEKLIRANNRHGNDTNNTENSTRDMD